MKFIRTLLLCLLAPCAQGAPIFTTLASFTGTNNGANPKAGLVQAADGNFYGTTRYGGASDNGTVFKLTPDGTLSNLHSFTYTADGAWPVAALLKGTNGSLYGVTTYGGANDWGTVFKILPTGVFIKMASFTSTHGEVDSPLIQGNDGNFYTVGDYGGAYGYGTVLKVTPGGAITVLHSFDLQNGWAGYYGNPLIQGSDTNFYGTTQLGGSGNGGYGYGTAYKMTPTGTLTPLIIFNGNNGYAPTALVQDADGTLYGTTGQGGPNGPSDPGTFFRLTTNGALSTLFTFSGANGASPTSQLIQGTDGNFYGTTTSGGASNVGTIFQAKPTGTVTTLGTFYGTNGSQPLYAALVQGTDGSFYGTTYYGGRSNLGTIFRITVLPTISQQPISQNGFAGDNVTFMVSASDSSSPPLRFQWRFDGSPLARQTNSTLVLTNLTLAQSGDYSVSVSNFYGRIISSTGRLTVIPTLSLPVALNANSLTWTTDGDARWHGLAGFSHDGFAAARSGPITNSQTSRLRTTVIGPGTLTFWWAVSSQTNSDLLTFSAGGIAQAAISGQVDWQQRTVYIGAGSQTLQWTYSKDANGTDGQDAGWVDEVTYNTGSTAPFIFAQPASQVLVAGRPVTFSVGVGGTPPLAYQWRLNGADLAGATNSSFALAQAWPTNNGAYSVVISNSYGIIISSNALLVAASLVAWGNNDFDQATLQYALTNVVAIAAGAYHSLALRADGSVFAWGYNYDGQCDVPAELTNAAAIAGGGYHSLAVRADGTVAAWGANDSGQATVPPRATNVVALAAGNWHSLALRSDGTIVAWGDDSSGQTEVPANSTNIVAIAGGSLHSLALRADGTVVAWGNNLGGNGMHAGQVDVPWDLSQVVAIAAGEFHSLALRSDGSVIGWGDNSAGQTSIPPELSKAVAIAAGGAHSLGVQEGGTLVAWGDNLSNESIPPADIPPVSAVAAGTYHSLALLAQTVVGPQLFNPSFTGHVFTVSLPTIRGKAYFLQYNTSLADPTWTSPAAIVGDGALKTLTDPTATAPQRFYRVRQQ